MLRPLGLVCAVLGAVLPGCADSSAVALLSDAPALDGWIRIDARIGGQSRVLEGVVRYERASGDLEFVHSQDGRSVALSQAGEGLAPQKSVDGAPAEVQVTDLGDLALLLSILQGRPEERAELRALDDGYEILGPGQAICVRYHPGAAAGG